ncbi:MAG: ATP synthase [Planctomycetes bacterium SM23_32]|nr:MAG: ATP synthase [Planctomycetes bacterium SM23_32]
MAFDLEHYRARVAGVDCMSYEGEVARVTGSIIEARSPALGLGQLCAIYPRHGRADRSVQAEVIGFRERTTVLMPLERLNGVQAGDRVVSAPAGLVVGLSRSLLGRVVDGLGRPIDGGDDMSCPDEAPIDGPSPHPLRRPPITEVFRTQVRAIDVALTLGKGQRAGIFSGSGVGKSTLLGQIARSSEADANVIALIGERGREVGHFIKENLGRYGLTKSVVVVATADAPPLLKVKAAFTSTTIAEYLRDCGMDVLYMMDSLTRVANAQREVGLAAGEPPTTRGYPPSAFSLLPTLTERLGNSERGNITGIYTVLVERDDFTEPVADTVRATLDGHIALARQLAERGHYPAIDVLGSVSRVMRQVVSKEHLDVVRRLKAILSTYREAEDLIKIGAYAHGSSPPIDKAIELMPELDRMLCQGIEETEGLESALAKFRKVTDRWEF